tara:strand:- start:97 stop:420 length:324 start_codon:yes stop_codon:yes gene_type:complete
LHIFIQAQPKYCKNVVAEINDSFFEEDRTNQIFQLTRSILALICMFHTLFSQEQGMMKQFFFLQKNMVIFNGSLREKSQLTMEDFAIETHDLDAAEASGDSASSFIS